jgi:hypothetical protein
MLPFEIEILQEQLDIENQVRRDRQSYIRYISYQITLILSAFTVTGYAFYYEFLRYYL